MGTTLSIPSPTGLVVHTKEQSPGPWESWFHGTMAVCATCVLIISLLGYKFCNLTLSLAQATPLALTLGILLLVAAQYRWRQEPKCFHITMMTLWMVMITNFHFFPMYMAAMREVPMSDSVLARMDRSLGMEVPTIRSTLQPYPTLNRSMLYIYGSLIPLMTLATVLPPIFNRMGKAKEFVLGSVVAASLTLPIFACFQAVGPWHYFHFDPVIPSLAGKHEMFLMLKTHAPFVIDVSNRDGLITFPSFHVILTVLAALTLGSFRILRGIVAVWAILIVISTVTTGIHYTVDVLGGLIVAIASWRLARLYLAWTKKREEPLNQLSPALTLQGSL